MCSFTARLVKKAQADPTEQQAADSTCGYVQSMPATCSLMHEECYYSVLRYSVHAAGAVISITFISLWSKDHSACYHGKQNSSKSVENTLK